MVRAAQAAICGERRRFAQDLHDQSGQDLAVLRLGLKRLEQHVHTAEGRYHLKWLAAQIDVMSDNLQRTVQNLLPQSGEAADIRIALRSLLDDWSRATSITVLFESNHSFGAARSPLGRSIYRIVQEALTNVSKHGRDVTQVVVRLSRRHERIVVTVAHMLPVASV